MAKRARSLLFGGKKDTPGHPHRSHVSKSRSNRRGKFKRMPVYKRGKKKSQKFFQEFNRLHRDLT